MYFILKLLYGSGIDEEQAIKNHLLMVKKMNNLINNEKK
jgi:hypothetical protein